MKYTVDFNPFDICDFPFWAGGKVWADLFFKRGLGDLLAEKIEEFLSIYQDNPPSITDINDYVWFDDELHSMLPEFADEAQA